MNKDRTVSRPTAVSVGIGDTAVSSLSHHNVQIPTDPEQKTTSPVVRRVSRRRRTFDYVGCASCIPSEVNCVADWEEIEIAVPEEKVTMLKRGGIIVNTVAGHVQYGMPPETIKDTLNLGMEVPTIYLVPRRRFDRMRGINVCEMEFPVYYNFFILRKRVKLIIEPKFEVKLRAVFQETLFGPKHIDLTDEYPHSSKNVPNLVSEMAHFRRNPFNPDEDMTLDTLIDVCMFDPCTNIADVGNGVKIQSLNDEYIFFENGQESVRLNSQVQMPSVAHIPLCLTTYFEPPRFGVTVLGASHGFDPGAATSGFVIWMNGRGIMVDPPLNSGQLLRASGIPAGVVDSIIISHCHADHDAGCFQKILDESRVTFITTPTIINSFLRKYAAIADLSTEFLRRLFDYRKVIIDEPFLIHGGSLRFWYTLHSIPTIGVEATFGDKSIIISGDCMYDPVKFEQLYNDGIISKSRQQQLEDCRFESATLILHEAGVPPLHTPMAILQKLPSHIKKKMLLYHVSCREIADDFDIAKARTGVENTIQIDATPPAFSRAVEFLDVLSSNEIFRSLPMTKVKDMLQVAVRKEYLAGVRVIEKGLFGDAFYIIIYGIARVYGAGLEANDHAAGDFFGETALLIKGGNRTASVEAITKLTVCEIKRHDFLYVMEGTGILELFKQLVNMRQLNTWKAIQSNTVLVRMSMAQTTQFQGKLHEVYIKRGEYLFDIPGDFGAFLVFEGSIELEIDGKSHPEMFRRGAFVGEFNKYGEGIDIEHCKYDGVIDPDIIRVRAFTDCRLFGITIVELRSFLQQNPGLFFSISCTVGRFGVVTV